MSLTVSHHSSSGSRAPGDGRRPRASRESARRRRRAPRAERDQPAGTGRARRDRGAPSARARAQTAAAAVIHSLRSGSAHTAIDAGRPGAGHAAPRRTPPSTSSTSMRPKRQSTPSTDASGRSIAAASSTRKSTFVDAELGCTAPRRLDHLGRDVGGEQAPGRAQALRGEEAGVSRARGKLEDRLARLRVRAAPPCAPRSSVWRPRTGFGVSPSRLRRRARLRDPRTPRSRGGSRELRDHVLAVRGERLLLPVRHQVDRVVVDADRLELTQLGR